MRAPDAPELTAAGLRADAAEQRLVDVQAEIAKVIETQDRIRERLTAERDETRRELDAARAQLALLGNPRIEYGTARPDGLIRASNMTPCMAWHTHRRIVYPPGPWLPVAEVPAQNGAE